jgi:hypothetical protein
MRHARARAVATARSVGSGDHTTHGLLSVPWTAPSLSRRRKRTPTPAGRRLGPAVLSDFGSNGFGSRPASLHRSNKHPTHYRHDRDHRHPPPPPPPPPALGPRLPFSRAGWVQWTYPCVIGRCTRRRMGTAMTAKGRGARKPRLVPCPPSFLRSGISAGSCRRDVRAERGPGAPSCRDGRWIGYDLAVCAPIIAVVVVGAVSDATCLPRRRRLGSEYGGRNKPFMTCALSIGTSESVNRRPSRSIFAVKGRRVQRRLAQRPHPDPSQPGTPSSVVLVMH